MLNLLYVLNPYSCMTRVGLLTPCGCAATTGMYYIQEVESYLQPLVFIGNQQSRINSSFSIMTLSEHFLRW